MTKFHGMRVGNNVVSEVFMLDKDTCVLDFESVEGNCIDTQTEVEYWLDDDTWHFVNNLYDKNGDYLDWLDVCLTDEEKEKCKDIIREFLKENQLD